MTKTFLIIANKESKDVDFFLICHAACNEIGSFQWFLMDKPNDGKKVYLNHQVYESIHLTSKWIKEHAENKWLGCHCNLPNNEYTEMLCWLSSDILSILRNNTLSSLSIFDENGYIHTCYNLDRPT